MIVDEALCQSLIDHFSLIHGSSPVHSVETDTSAKHAILGLDVEPCGKEYWGSDWSQITRIGISHLLLLVNCRKKLISYAAC